MSKQSHVAIVAFVSNLGPLSLSSLKNEKWGGLEEKKQKRKAERERGFALEVS